MKKLMMPLAMLALAVACKDGDDTGDTASDTGDTDTGTVEEFGVATEWPDDATFDITLSNTTATGFYFGWAETAAGVDGWYGEACDPDNCHEFTGLTGTLTSVDDIDDVVFDSTTLFDGDTDGQGDAFTSDGADRLTYIVALIGGGDACYVWGEDVSYYDADGCTELTGL